MSEEKRREIPIEDENSETEKTGTVQPEEEQKPEEQKESAEAGEEAGEKQEEQAEPDINPEAEAKKAAEAAKQESERYLRLLADFQNFRTRTEKEKADIRAYANEKMMGDLLPVLDNFERALQSRTDDAESYAKGMEMIFQQLLAVFEKAGVKEIAAEGEAFDPNKHNAVMTDTSDELDDGMISKVLQKGYTLNGRVIRPAMVAVVKK